MFLKLLITLTRLMGNIGGVIKGLIDGYSNNAEYLINNIERKATRDEVKKHLNKSFDVIKNEISDFIDIIKKNNKSCLENLNEDETKIIENCKTKEEDLVEYTFNIFKDSNGSICVVVAVKMSLESLCTPLLIKNLIITSAPLIVKKAIKLLTWKESKNEDHINLLKMKISYTN